MRRPYTQGEAGNAVLWSTKGIAAGAVPCVCPVTITDKTAHISLPSAPRTGCRCSVQLRTMKWTQANVGATHASPLHPGRRGERSPMEHERDSGRRRSLRLPGYDYGQDGAYFVTICTHDRRPLFGPIVGAEMRLNDAGRIAAQCWSAIPHHHSNAAMDEFIVMPNHVHGIIFIRGVPSRPNGTPGEGVGATRASPLPRGSGPTKGSLGAIVGSYKSAVTREINRLRGTPAGQVWQRNYYEHVIRNEAALHDIRQYIANNPVKWADDPENVPPTEGRPMRRPYRRR